MLLFFVSSGHWMLIVLTNIHKFISFGSVVVNGCLYLKQLASCDNTSIYVVFFFYGKRENQLFLPMIC